MECPACHHGNVDGARFCAKCGAPLPASAPSEADPLLGSVVGGRFRVTDVVGEGGMGRVYSAEQQMGTSVRKVAIKTLLAQYAKDQQTVARFMREVSTVAELEHPHTVKVYDYGQTPSGELYIAMEFLQGKSLEDVVQEGAIAPERVDKILGQVCGSLQEAHEKGIVHRDLKPANIHLSKRAGEEDYVKVLDFGIAKRDEKKGDSKAEKLTQQGTILGTPPYMSPEQFTGKELDARSDIYSLGVIAYEMLTGRLPFEADTPWQWATQHMTAQPFPFEQVALAGHVPPKMKAAIMRALSKDKAQRQPTVREFYEDLSIGGQRLSMLGAVPSGGSMSMPGTQPAPTLPSGGTQVMGAPSAGAARAGGTQVGEPLYVSGAPSGAQTPAGRTLMEPVPATAPQGAPAQGAPLAVPAPAAQPQKSNTGMIIGIAAVVGVAALVISVIALRKPSGGDGPTLELPTASTVTLTGEEPDAGATADAGGTEDAGAKPVPTTTATTTKTQTATDSTDAKAQEACVAATNLARGNNTVLAVASYRQCKGPKQAEARAAIDGAALREVQAKGCKAKPSADAAASIGATSGHNALPASCSKPTPKH